MTIEEAIKYWEELRKTFSSQLEQEENHFGRMHLQTTIDVIDTTLSAIRAKQEQESNEPKWISVKDRMPKQEECVLLLCKTQYGTSYKCIGFYESGTMRRDDSDYCWDYEVCDIYDEENDDYLVNKGWFERVFNWDDYSAYGIEDTVTHWMPLPEPPKEETL